MFDLGGHRTALAVALLQIGAAKLVVSVVLAGLAWAVQRRVRHPAVTYPLWLLVLVAPPCSSRLWFRSRCFRERAERHR